VHYPPINPVLFCGLMPTVVERLRRTIQNAILGQERLWAVELLLVKTPARVGICRFIDVLGSRTSGTIVLVDTTWARSWASLYVNLDAMEVG